MKKLIYIWVIALVVVLSACEVKTENPGISGTVEPTVTASVEPPTESPGTQSEEPSAPVESELPAPVLSVEDFFPVASNTLFYYTGEGNEYASFIIFNDYTKNDKIQQCIDNGGTTVARVLELRDGAVASVYTRGEAYFRENLLEAKGSEEVLLMEPIEIGTTWTLEDSSERKITGVAVDVSTPAGNYVAVEVLTEMKDGRTVDYYAKGVGLVKTVYTSEDLVVTSMLSSVERDAARQDRITLFYPGAEGDTIEAVDAEVSFATNDITRKVLEHTYRNGMGPGMLPVFTENTEINSLYLNSDGMVYLDLNAAFIEEMNAGTTYESKMLQSIANTFGMYYNADKVILTIDDGLYSSGHYEFKTGEYLEVVPLDQLQSNLPEGMVAIIDDDDLVPLAEELTTIKPAA